jgi:hypothetical protein
MDSGVMVFISMSVKKFKHELWIRSYLQLPNLAQPEGTISNVGSTLFLALTYPSCTAQYTLVGGAHTSAFVTSPATFPITALAYDEACFVWVFRPWLKLILATRVPC